MPHHIAVKPRVTQLMYSANSGFQYRYAVDGAPWIQPRIAHDHDLPEHWQAMMEHERAKHPELHISDGNRTIILRPLIDFVMHHETQDGRHIFRVYVNWFKDDDPVPQHGESYDLDLVEHAEFYRHHLEHKADLHARIPVHLDMPTHGLPHRRGCGPIKGDN